MVNIDSYKDDTELAKLDSHQDWTLIRLPSSSYLDDGVTVNFISENEVREFRSSRNVMRAYLDLASDEYFSVNVSLELYPSDLSRYVCYPGEGDYAYPPYFIVVEDREEFVKVSKKVFLHGMKHWDMVIAGNLTINLDSWDERDTELEITIRGKNKEQSEIQAREGSSRIKHT